MIQIVLSDVFVGASKEIMKDQLSHDMPLLPTVAIYQFGKYLKEIVVLEETVPDAVSTHKNAFDVMARAASQKGVPQHNLGRNQKDKLYNDILSSKMWI